MASNSEKITTNGGEVNEVNEISPPPTLNQDVKAPKDVEKVIAHSHDADEAMSAFTSGEIIEVDEATSKRLLRIIDWHLMPIMCLCYGIQFLDKVAISYASIMGLETDLNLKGAEYQWLGSMFYFGYLFWEYPTNRLLQRLPLAKYSAFNIVMWGITLACMAATTNFGGALAVRFFLGMLESAVTPGFMLFTSQWYTRTEQGARAGIWFSFNGVAQIVGGTVSYGIAVGAKTHNFAIAPWRIVFLTFGLLTASLGLIFLWVMPDNQLNARWLSKTDRVLAVARVRGNQQGIGNKHFKMYQFKEALTDPVAWAFVLFALLGDISNGGLTNFFSQLIVSFGYTREQALLYGTPGGAVEIIFLVACGWLGDKIRRRLLVSLVGMSTALLGIVLIVGLPLSNSPGRLAGYYMTQASAAPFVALLSLIGTNVAGYTKKTTVSAMYLIAYCKCYTSLVYQPHILTRPSHRCRQFHRPTDLQTKRRTSICAC